MWCTCAPVYSGVVSLCKYYNVVYIIIVCILLEQKIVTSAKCCLSEHQEPVFSVVSNIILV